jgi:hypothetical protein
MDAKDIPPGPARDAAMWLEQTFPERYGNPETRRLLRLERMLRKLRRRLARQGEGGEQKAADGKQVLTLIETDAGGEGL